MKLLKFSASWCNPCKMLSESMGQVNLNGYELQEIDIDHDQDLVASFGVRSVPTMIIIDDDGTEVKRNTGVMSPGEIKQWLDI